VIRIERRGAIGLLTLDKARGNAIDPPLVEALIDAERQLRSDGEVRGVLLASAHPKLFSPGLDLVTLVEFDRPAMQHFMLRFAEMVWALYALPKPLLAAVSGHAIAGGCILALTADWRLLARGAQIGLNEVKVGVPLPWSVAVLLKASVPPHALSRVALLGRNFAEEEALGVGLADELAASDGFPAAALARLEEFAEKDPASFAGIKSALREANLASMRAEESARLGSWLDGWFSEPTQTRIRAAVASITKK
jgi:enoyl-CoA hydratase/carnithine racemase